MKLRPLGNRVVVRPDSPPEKEGRIFRPETAAPKSPDSGIVVAVGDELMPALAHRLTEGCRVAFPPFAGVTYLVDGEPMRALDANEILGYWPAEVAS